MSESDEENDKDIDMKLINLMFHSSS